MQPAREWDLTGILPKLLEFRSERDWEQFHRPKELVSAINIESGELMEHFLWREKENTKQIHEDVERFHGIQEEIADIAIYLLYLSNDLEINLRTAIIKKLEKNALKYPKGKYQGRF